MKFKLLLEIIEFVDSFLTFRTTAQRQPTQILIIQLSTCQWWVVFDDENSIYNLKLI